MRHHAVDCLTLFNQDVARNAALREPAPTTPEWLPEGAVAYADFVNGHYWADGAEIVPAAFIEADDLAAGTIGVDGFTGFQMRFIGAFKTTTMNAAGATIVVEVETGNTDYVSTGFYDEGGTTWINSEARSDKLKVQVYDDPEIFEEDSDLSTLLQDYQIQRHAMSLTPTYAAASLNGSVIVKAIESVAIAELSLFIIYAQEVPDWTGQWRSITVYPVQDDAALPALSALS